MLSQKTKIRIQAVIGGLLLIALWLKALLALKLGHLFIGANYKYVAIDTYALLAVLVPTTPVLLWLAIKHVR